MFQKLNTATAVLATALTLLHSGSAAASDNKITNIKVDGDTVHFSTSHAKSHTLPNCVTSGNSQQWTLSLTSAAGKASYTLLVAAMTDNRSVAVTSANDCADSTGYERAQSIEVGNASQQSSGKMMTLYQGDGVTKVGAILDYGYDNSRGGSVFTILQDEGNSVFHEIAPYTNVRKSNSFYYEDASCTGEVRVKQSELQYYYYSSEYNSGRFFMIEPKGRMIARYYKSTDGQCHRMGQWEALSMAPVEPATPQRYCGVAICQIKTE
ncbi:hypothetical protein [Pseudoalteromonas aurantia]|uniref:Uncharacterized protein n=1 Tax=Pseudoalteromonas aurantia 208 TaxID=1314867 RepID=A0ABR9EAT6_9GAMM|nr:hypothetical protein [Pseudoalteromonas aurantia]MBE0368093.1 hypothetical protein [Pseudoalteromonas aurantia 208]